MKTKGLLDLRFKGKLDPDINLLFNQISNEKRDSFNDIVSILSEPHIHNIELGLEGPASRNIESSLFPTGNYKSYFF